MKEVTLSMVAARAGVSRTTVSRVMNNHLAVFPETSAKVMQAAKELGYHLSPREGRRNIGVIIYRGAKIAHYLAMAFSALRLELQRRNYRMELVSIDDVELLRERVLSGVIDLSHDYTLNERWESLRALPLVRCFCPPLHRDGIYSVVNDGAACFREMVAYLGRLGHRRIAFVSDIPEEQERRRTARYLDGFLTGMHQLGEFAPERFCAFHDKTENRTEFSGLLRDGATAIICTNESYGPRIAREIRELGYRIPEDVSLISHELDEVSEYLTPPHTTYATDNTAMAVQALDILELLMEGRPVPESGSSIPFRFIERGSVAACVT